MTDSASTIHYALEVENLTKTYGNVRALDDLSFRVPEGVIAGFVGPNGSGKTTTMRILATLLRQDQGTAKVFGLSTHLPAEARKVRHAIGFMPDYFGLYNDMTAGEYLDFFAAAYRIPSSRRPALIKDILDIIGLAPKKDTIIAGLSRGMQQRLSLGRCLVHNPKLLLLDEPASGLDPRARIELMELLRELRQMGKTILISSHILSELHNLSDMVVIIENGRLAYSGTVHQASAHIRAGRDYFEIVVEANSEPSLENAVRAIEAIEGVREVRHQANVVFVELDSTLRPADLLQACHAAGIRVEEARRSTANLEEIFMSLTKG